MEKQRNLDDIFDFEWQDPYQNAQLNQIPFLTGLFQYRDQDIFASDFHEKPSTTSADKMKRQQQINLSPLKQQNVTAISQQDSSQQSLKRQHFNREQQKNIKDFKNERQQFYSKVYRQKKKEKFRILQQQNEYLKKRITQLESQLRENQIELNRFKYPPPQKELSVQELNKQLVEVTTDLLKNLQSQPEQQPKKQYPTQNYFHQFFLQSYAERGFAGKKKLKILNYHFNQLLQTLLKDSEKYLSLVYSNSKRFDELIPLPQFELINKAFYQVFHPDEDMKDRLNVFNKFLQPISIELGRHIGQFYKKFEDILQCSNRIHNFLKQTYLSNMDVATKRLQMQKWFDFYKYGKMMRKLRYQWFEHIKEAGKKVEQKSQGAKRGAKKKKTNQ